MISESSLPGKPTNGKALTPELETGRQNIGNWKWTAESESLTCSHGIYKIFGKSEDEPITLNMFAENVFPEDTFLIENCLAKLKTNHHGLHLAYRIFKNGKLRHLILSVDAHLASNHDLVGTIEDITDRKGWVNEVLPAMPNMPVVESNDLVWERVRIVAHEIRNPLTTLNVALRQLFIETTFENAESKMIGDIIQRNINRIEQLVDDMLHTVKEAPLPTERVGLTEIIEDALVQAIDRISLNDIKLEVSYHPEPPLVSTDKIPLTLAVLNIVINGIESMIPGKGVLKIATYRTGDSEIISITDNGTGIAPGYLKTLFDPFCSQKEVGMGLGLATTKNILDRYGVELEINAEIPTGTTFRLVFKKE